MTYFSDIRGVRNLVPDTCPVPSLRISSAKPSNVPFLPCGFHPQNRPMFRSFPADFIRKTTHLSTSNLPTSFRATNRYRSDVTGIGR